MIDMSEGIARLNALENDNFQEALNKYPAFLKLPDDIIYSLSREFVDTVKNENIIFLSFHGQVCVDLQSAALSTLRQHDAQACLMLRHALEATALAAYATIFKPGADEAGIMAEFGHTGKAYKWIEAEFPESSKNIKRLKEKINENFSHANITTAAPNISERDGKLNLHFFDTNSAALIGPRLYVISEIAWIAMDLLEKAIVKANNGIVVQEGTDKRIKDFSEQIDKVFAELKTAKS